MELAARFFHPNYKTPLVEEVPYDGILWYKVNRSYLKKYFSTNDIQIPELKPSLFRKTKTPNTFRILCLGESSMFGVPYQMTATIPGILRRQLRHLYPEKEIEVINFGASAINSNVILNFSEELLQFSPDLVLIYTGHNEFYGPDGIGASWIEKQFPFLIQWKYSLREFALLKLFESESRLNVDFKDANLMKQVSQGASVEFASPEVERIYSQFERNLSKIISTFQGKNIPVVVSDITSNDTFAPFKSSDEISNAQNFSLSELRIEEQKFPNSASIKFAIANKYSEAKNYDSAKIYYHLACNYDLLKFRAPSGINEVIKKITAKLNTPFFSSDSIFTLNSRNGISDTTLFWEHLHPKPIGYYLIANGFIQQIQKEKLLPAASVKLLSFQYDSLNICWLDLAFGDRSIKNLTSKWPFQNYSVNTTFYPNAPAELLTIVDDVFSSGKIWDQACYETAQYFWMKGNTNAAVTTFNAVIEEYPYNFYAHYLLANALNQTGKIEEAINHYRISSQSNELYPYPKTELGLILVNSGKFDEAIAMLNSAIPSAQQEKSAPLQSTIYYGLATAYANKRDFSSAIKNADLALQIMPTNRDVIVLKQKIAGMMK